MSTLHALKFPPIRYTVESGWIELDNVYKLVHFKWRIQSFLSVDWFCVVPINAFEKLVIFCFFHLHNAI